jgi:hypothetical protein
VARGERARRAQAELLIAARRRDLERDRAASAGGSRAPHGESDAVQPQQGGRFRERAVDLDVPDDRGSSSAMRARYPVGSNV